MHPKLKAETRLHYTHNTGILEIQAPSILRLFSEAALAVCDVRTPLETIEAEAARQILLEGKDLSGLFEAWMRAILTPLCQERWFFSKVILTDFAPNRLKATLHGEAYNPVKHAGAWVKWSLQEARFEPASEGFVGRIRYRIEAN